MLARLYLSSQHSAQVAEHSVFLLLMGIRKVVWIKFHGVNRVLLQDGRFLFRFSTVTSPVYYFSTLFYLSAHLAKIYFIMQVFGLEYYTQLNGNEFFRSSHGMHPSSCVSSFLFETDRFMSCGLHCIRKIWGLHVLINWYWKVIAWQVVATLKLIFLYINSPAIIIMAITVTKRSDISYTVGLINNTEMVFSPH